MARKMTIERVEGLAELLRAHLLPTPMSRMVEPDRETLENVMRAGNAFIEHEAGDPQHEGRTIYTAYQWPETGPATLSLVWAVNTRQPHDPVSNLPYFFRAYTETAEPHDHLLSVGDMEEQLAAYAVASYGRPQAVD